MYVNVSHVEHAISHADTSHVEHAMSHADTSHTAYAQCRGVRRIVQCLNMLLRVLAPDEHI